MGTPEQKALNKEKRARQQKRAFLILPLIILAPFILLTGIPLVWGPIGVNIHYSEGERKIKLVKIASKGLFWKTWEIEGLIAPGQGMMTTYIWDFSIDNDDPKKEEWLQIINDAYTRGAVINIHYDQRAGYVPWRSDTSYLVKSID